MAAGLLACRAAETSAPPPIQRGCLPPPYTPERFAQVQTALKPGDRAPLLSLRRPDGSAWRLEEALARGPVLLISGSMTCPVYRDNRAKIDRLSSTFGDRLQVVVVHGPEAHPRTGPSPYRGSPWPARASDREEATSWEQRAAWATTLGPPPRGELLVEDLDHPFWCSFGTAPNGAWLLDRTGRVEAAHDWFDAKTMVGSVQALLARGG
jgi:hypothetical protein